MAKKLIVIGASYLQLPLVLRARAMGVETHVFAWEDGAVAKEHCHRFYPISIVEKDAILREATRIRPDGVTSIASDLATVTVNYLANELGLTSNSPEATAHTTNKYLMRRRLSGDGLPCPRFVAGNEALGPNSPPLRFPVIVKPTDRSGSRGVTKVERPSELPASLERAAEASFASETIVEEFIEGREVSLETISWRGRHHFLAVTDKVTTGPPYCVEAEQHQPGALAPETKSVAVETVFRALDSLGVEFGASHSELLITPDNEIFILEIGARMGGDFIGSHLVSLSTGYDFVEGVIEVALGRFTPPAELAGMCAGVYYLFPPGGTVTEIVDRTDEFPEIVESAVFVKPGDELGAVRASAERPGYFIYAAPEKFVPKTTPIEILTRRDP